MTDLALRPEVPKYMPDPQDEKDRIRLDASKVLRGRTGVFKPPSSQKTRPISLMSPLDMTGPNPVSLRDTLL